MIGWCGGYKTMLFVFQIRLILWCIFGTIKFVNPPCQVHPYGIPLSLFQKVAVSWCLSALLLQAAPLCAHSRVSINIVLQSLVRACVVATFLVWFLPGEWKDNMCCGCWFFLPLLLVLSASVSEVSASVAWWSVSGVGYCMRHLWRNWLLWKVGRLAQ